MSSVWTMGEILVGSCGPRAGIDLYAPAEFLGPYPSGAPAIFIDMVARLGHPAGIVGGVGADDFGRCVVDRLRRDGVNCDFVPAFPGRFTAVAFVTYFADGSRKFIYHIDGTPAVMATLPAAADLGAPAFFHVMGCSLMANEEFRHRIYDAMLRFRQAGARVSFDPNIRAELLGSRSIDEIAGPVLAECSVLLPGVGELALLGGMDSVAENVGRLFATTPLELIVVKRGSKGCTVFTRTSR